MFKPTMPLIKISTAVSMAISVMLAYYLLLSDNCFHCGITSIINYSNGLTIKQHVIVMGLLPIYIAMMIFGAVIIGLYIGSIVENTLTRAYKK